MKGLWPGPWPTSEWAWASRCPRGPLLWLPQDTDPRWTLKPPFPWENRPAQTLVMVGTWHRLRHGERMTADEHNHSPSSRIATGQAPGGCPTGPPRPRVTLLQSEEQPEGLGSSGTFPRLPTSRWPIPWAVEGQGAHFANSRSRTSSVVPNSIYVSINSKMVQAQQGRHQFFYLLLQPLPPAGGGRADPIPSQG